MGLTRSPLRYPGGKGSLSQFLTQVIRLNGIVDGTYIEPFAGGAGAAISLLLEGTVGRIVLNDFDPLVYSFWVSALNETDKFVDLLNKIPLDVEEWHRQRLIVKNPGNHSLFKVGFAAFYMNRCNRSGILTAGPIGGQHQSGNYTIGARFNRSVLSEKLREISRERDRIYVHNLDAIDFISRVVTEIDGQKLIYLDPPYYDKGNLLYLNSYNHDDHENLAWALTKLPASTRWLLTYDDVVEIRELYAKRITTSYSLNYFAHHAKKGNEVLICQPGLILPNHVDVNYGLI